MRETALQGYEVDRIECALDDAGNKTGAIEISPVPNPKLTDDVAAWLPPRIAAARVEAFFAMQAQLTARSRASIVVERADVTPWEHLLIPAEADGSKGTYRAPHATCTLSANNDYEAVQAGLSLQESAATQRAYRKEAERLTLWAVLERGKALTSLTTENAIVYRQFLRRLATA